jgi:hypothetical protein
MGLFRGISPSAEGDQGCSPMDLANAKGALDCPFLVSCFSFGGSPDKDVFSLFPAIGSGSYAF